MSESEILENAPKETNKEATSYLIDAVLDLSFARQRGNTKETKSALAKITYGVIKGIKNSGIQWISIKDLIDLAIKEEKEQETSF